MTVQIPASQGTPVGETRVQIVLTNMFTKTRVEVRALVDTGTSGLIVTPEVAKALGFDIEEVRRQWVTVANGRSERAPVIAPVQIEFEDRACSTDGFVLNSGECLLGCIPLEQMDLALNPKEQRLVLLPQLRWLARRLNLAISFLNQRDQRG